MAGLSAEEVAQLIAGQAQAATPAPAMPQTPAVPASASPVAPPPAEPAPPPATTGGLTAEDVARMIAIQSKNGAQPSNAPGMLETFARGVGGGATLEYGDDLGLLDREKQNAAKKANPWSYTLGSILGGTAPMLALGPIGVGARLGATGRAISAATTPARSATWMGAAGQGVKTGTVWGGLYGSGAADPTADMSPLEALKARAVGGLTGAVEGGIIGGPLNVAIHGGTRAISSVADRVMPGLREGASFARDPEAQGLSSILADARRDMVNFDDALARMTPKARGNTIPQSQINEIIDLHTKGVAEADIAKQVGRPVSTIKDWIGRYNTEVGRDFEGQSILETLKTPSQRGEIVTTKNLDDLATYAANTPGEGQNVTRQAMLQRKADQPNVINEAVDRIFKTGDLEKHRDDVVRQGAETFSKLYGQLHKPGNVAPWPTMAHLEPRIVNDPLFREALSQAERLARVRGAIPPEASFGDIFHPGVIDYTQRVLRRMAEGTGDNAQLAQAIREEFLKNVDKHIAGFPELRSAYRTHMLRGEMMDAGQRFNLTRAIKGGSKEAEVAKEFDKQLAITKNRSATDLERAQAEAVVSDFRRALGQSVKDMFDSGRDPLAGNTASTLGKLQARAVEANLRRFLPKDKADEMLAILDRERRKIDTGQTLYGNSKTEQRQRKSASMDALTDIAAGIGTLRLGRILRGSGDLFSDKLREARADRINQTLAATDMNAVRRLLMTLRDMDRNRTTVDRTVGRTSRAILPSLSGTTTARIEGKD